VAGWEQLLSICTAVHIIRLMDYQWDRNKAQANFRKHGVSFADATSVFEDEMALSIEDEHPSEDRYMTIGLNALGQILVVVYTWRGNQIRIISARHATPRERRQYEENDEG
jgi:uncharacterized DUF497 family protein